jgi:hypothetical protein
MFTAAALLLTACRAATPTTTPSTPSSPGVTAVPANETPAATAPPSADEAPQAPTVAPEVTQQPEPTPDPAAESNAAAQQAQQARPASNGSLPSTININAATIADRVRADTMPGAQAIGPETPAFEAGLPTHVRIAFDEDSLTNEYVDTQQRQILIIPVKDYLALFENSPDIRQDVQGQIDTLKSLLRRRNTRINGPIPVLPITNAAQVFAARIKYLTFNGGSGVRFVTAYAQDAGPITSQDLFYTFQGLSTDGKFYISAFFPVRIASLAESDDKVEKAESDQAATQFERYVRTVVAKVEKPLPSDFDPSLTNLDEVLATLGLGEAPEAVADSAAQQPAAEATKAPEPASGNAVVPTSTPAGAADQAAQQPAAVQTGRATTVVNLRATPSTRARILLRVRRGQSIQILGRNEAGTWLKVRVGRRDGWMSADYISGADVDALPVSQ